MTQVPSCEVSFNFHKDRFSQGRVFYLVANPCTQSSNWVAVFCNVHEVAPWGVLRMQFSLLDYLISMGFGTNR